MSRTELIQRLRPHRRKLVLSAEATVDSAFSGKYGERPAKTQFSRLVNICGEASCAEEIANYLRYQAGRDAKVWPIGFVKAVIQGIEGPLTAIEAEGAPAEELDATRVEAWRLYATYLTRAFTYQEAVHKSMKNLNKDPTRGSKGRRGGRR